MKYYSVIDTNVLVSAMLRWDSVPGKIMEHAFIGDILPLYLITGNKKHFPNEVFVVTPREMLSIMEMNN